MSSDIPTSTPNIGTNAELGAKGPHRGIVGVGTHVERPLMVGARAEAPDGKAADAERPHVAEGRGRADLHASQNISF